MRRIRFDVDEEGIVRIADENGAWWCGDEHEWVHPNSSHWSSFPDLWEIQWGSIAAAVKFARGQGWIR